MHELESPEKAMKLMQMVEESIRRSGGKALLSRDEYLEILVHCHQVVYGLDLTNAKTNSAALLAQSR